MELIKQGISINQTVLHNRLVMPPMETRKATDDGKITNAILQYYDERSRGGAIALVITEHTNVAPEGKAAQGQLSISSDDCVSGLALLVAQLHSNGSKVFAQLAHAGSSAPTEVVGADNVVAPSAVENPGMTGKKGIIPRTLTLEEIARVREYFVAAALRAKAAGFDGVEVHAAHGYLLNQFYSPITNKRTDAYTGATLEGRLRLHVEILKAIRSAVGNDFAVGIRFSAADYGFEGGAKLDELAAAAKILEATGIDFIDVSGGLNAALRKGHREPGYFSDAAVIVRQNVSIPVILAGGVKTLDEAEQLLQDGKADLIGVGRPLFAHADWARKAMGMA